MTSNFLGSHNGLPFLTEVLFNLEEPPILALRINEALSTNIFVISSADFVFTAFDKSVIFTAG